jgi:hypothetical protein
MPRITEYGKIFRDWEGLLGAAEKRTPMLPGVDDFKAALAVLLKQAKDLKLAQEGFSGDKKATTEKLQKVVKDGRDAASMLRAFVKGRIGLRTEVLKEFGIAPIRSRKRAVKTPEEPPPSAPGTTPEKPATAGAKEEAPQNPTSTAR